MITGLPLTLSGLPITVWVGWGHAGVTPVLQRGKQRSAPLLHVSSRHWNLLPSREVPGRPHTQACPRPRAGLLTFARCFLPSLACSFQPRPLSPAPE